MSNEWHGSEHGYGAINLEDVAFLEKTILRASSEFPQPLKLLEVGTANGYTGRGIGRFCAKHNIRLEYHCIDNECGKPHPGVMPEGGTFHLGNSHEIFDQIPGGFHILFIDACHCNNCCCLDFLNYGPKVAVGGYALFHDTNSSPKWQGYHDHTWQGHGPKIAPFCIATRAALKKLGLIGDKRRDWYYIDEQNAGEGLGMMLFKKISD